MNKLSKYEKQAGKLSKAIEIAEQIIKESSDFNADWATQMLAFGAQVKRMALHPEPKFRRLTSLKYLESDFFTFWNESRGTDIDKFWDKVLKSDLGYVRKDAIQNALKRKKIKTMQELDFIVDNLVVYEQTGRLNREQVIELNKYIGEFEKKKVCDSN
jgi:hypothetical protein